MAKLVNEIEIEDLITFGQKNGVYEYYKQRYSYSYYKEKLDNAYNIYIKGNFNKAIEEFDKLYREVEQFKDLYDSLCMDEARGNLQLSQENLEKLCQGILYEDYGLNLLLLIDACKKKVLLEYFDFVGEGNIGAYSSSSKYGFNRCKDEREVKKLYRKLSKELHPDLGGDKQEFVKMKKEYEKHMKQFN